MFSICSLNHKHLEAKNTSLSGDAAQQVCLIFLALTQDGVALIQTSLAVRGLNEIIHQDSLAEILPGGNR